VPAILGSRGLKDPLLYPWAELGQFDAGCDWSTFRHSRHSYVINKHRFSALVLLYIGIAGEAPVRGNFGKFLNLCDISGDRWEYDYDS
jgi:hypothetical protein